MKKERAIDMVSFDDTNKIMSIYNGTVGEYAYTNLQACEVLCEKAKYHGKEKPFYVTVKPTRLPLGMMSDTAFYVGVKVILKDNTELAIYVSKEKTRSYTDFHLQDEKIAKRIKRKIDKIVKENNEV